MSFSRSSSEYTDGPTMKPLHKANRSLSPSRMLARRPKEQMSSIAKVAKRNQEYARSFETVKVRNKDKKILVLFQMKDRPENLQINFKAGVPLKAAFKLFSSKKGPFQHSLSYWVDDQRLFPDDTILQRFPKIVKSSSKASMSVEVREDGRMNARTEFPTGSKVQIHDNTMNVRGLDFQESHAHQDELRKKSAICEKKSLNCFFAQKMFCLNFLGL